MKKLIVVAGALTVAVVAGLLVSQLAAQTENKTDAFMQIKLKRAQDVLAGLALEDYDSVAKNAQGLMLLSNESNWNVFQTVEYNRLSREFRDSTARLRKAAKEKNLDGATLAYFEVTLNCVRCHKYTRTQR